MATSAAFLMMSSFLPAIDAETSSNRTYRRLFCHFLRSE
jgi:hypothetical protein